MKLPISISRWILSSYVLKKTSFLSDRSHALSIATILFEEIINELMEGKEVIIGNFCRMRIKQLADRYHTDVVTGNKVISKGKKTLRISMTDEFSRKICSLIDLEKLMRVEGKIK